MQFRSLFSHPPHGVFHGFYAAVTLSQSLFSFVPFFGLCFFTQSNSIPLLFPLPLPISITTFNSQYFNIIIPYQLYPTKIIIFRIYNSSSLHHLNSRFHFSSHIFRSSCATIQCRDNYFLSDLLLS